ncbi:MAG: 2-oxoglutarate dehydrogenase E1 subunit family protein [Actinomycetota bacterium]
MSEKSNPEDFGANSWLVEEMYERYREEPQSLSVAWREFFSATSPSARPNPTRQVS